MHSTLPHGSRCVASSGTETWEMKVVDAYYYRGLAHLFSRDFRGAKVDLEEVRVNLGIRQLSPQGRFPDLDLRYAQATQVRVGETVTTFSVVHCLRPPSAKRWILLVCFAVLTRPG